MRASTSLRLRLPDKVRCFSIAPVKRRSALALRDHNPEHGSEFWTPLQRYQRNIFEVRRMEHHVLAAAMETAANEKHFNKSLWLEYLKRCRDLVDAPLFTGRDLSKVLSALTRVRFAIINSDSTRTRIVEDILTAAEKRILDTSQNKLCFTTPQQIAWTAYGICKLSRLSAEAAANLADRFVRLVADDPSVRSSAKDCGMILAAFKTRSPNLLEFLCNHLLPAIDVYDFIEWKYVWTCLATMLAEGHHAESLSQDTASPAARTLARLGCILEEHASELGPHEVSRILSSISLDSCAFPSADCVAALLKRVKDLRDELSVADIAGIASGLHSGHQIDDAEVVACLLSRLTDLAIDQEPNARRFITATSILCEAAHRMSNSYSALVFENFRLQSEYFIRSVISEHHSMKNSQ
ncbi:hypothetical protein FOL47_008190, partial [Perkinsus chesapeaki]